MATPPITRTLRLLPYDSAWPTRFTDEVARLRPALGAAVQAIEHMGSTAVPGLPGKPVLDIAIAVENDANADACIAPMQSLGYEFRGPYGDDPRRRYYVRNENGASVVHVHLYVLPAAAWHALLAFRDALRADTALSAAYAAEKYRVAESVDWDKIAYSLAKGPFVQRVLADVAKFAMCVIAACLVAACASPSRDTPAATEGVVRAPSPYLLVSAADADETESDFLAVIDVREGSPTVGTAISTLPTGMNASMPHHMEYTLPPAGELLFLNAHHHEATMLLDVSNPSALGVVKTFMPPKPLRFPHDYTRTPSGTRLVGFLRSEGKSLDTTETVTPGNHGGIAEYRADGTLLRTAIAGDADGKPVRPYAFALLPKLDRLVVTSAPMMESSWADVVQIYRYSDFTLLSTMALPAGRGPDGELVPGSERAGFGPRVLEDRSVFLNSYGCTFYRLSEIDSSAPRLETFFALATPPADAKKGDIRGACGIPVVFGHYWINPVGKLHSVVVLDIADPSNPREVFRLTTPDTFNPHWLARDPNSNRLILGAELGGEDGYFMLRFDEQTGALRFDPAFRGDGQAGYISLKQTTWPHGASGAAWGHAALFLPATH